MAKKTYDLYPQLCSFENLFLAFRAAAKGKRGKPSVAEFERDLEPNLFRLRDALLDRTYRPGSYRSFWIRDPKRRLVSAAPFQDRVVHHALCQVTEPPFERRFIGASFANRKGKGTHAAIDLTQRWARRYPFVLQCDVREFFASIDHETLRGLLARVIGDQDVLGLAGRILESGEGVLAERYTMVYFSGDDLFAVNRPRGLPIGNLTSQFWANVYLDALDQFVLRELRCRAYLRYVDDFLLFADSKRQLWEWKAAVRDRLASLRLVMHERSSTVFPTATGVPFLGFTVYPSHRRLRRRNVVAFARRLRRARRALARGECTVDDVFANARGWIAHAAHADSWRLRASLLREPLHSGRS